MKKVVLIALVFLLACNQDAKMKTEGGIQFLSSGLKCPIEKEEYLLMDMVVLTASDSLVFSTRSLGRKLELDLNKMNRQSTVYKLLSTVCVGDSIQMQLSADSFYLGLGGVRPAQLQKGILKVQAWMSDKLNYIQYEAHKQAFELESMEKYVKKFGWNTVFDSTTGIYYEKLKAVRSVKMPFKKGKFKYSLKTINDQLIAYSKEEDPLIVNWEDNSILKGIHYLMGQMNEHESLRAIIPSNMAFGSNGNGKVPAHQPVIVELEFLEKLK